MSGTHARAPLGLPELLGHAPGLAAVFADMDGTLLLPDSTLPADAPGVIRRLQATGVRFVPTSGRALWSLRAVFGDLADELDFVAANGMDVIAGGRVLRHVAYDPAAAGRLLRAARESPRQITTVMFGRGASYLYDGDLDLARAMGLALREGELRVGRDDLPDEPVTKLALVASDDAGEVAAELRDAVAEDFVLAPCGGHWIDVLVRGADKATGVMAVLDSLGAAPDRAIAFGDSMNDEAMMRLVPRSVAVANAMPALRELCAYQIGPNSQASVIDACRRIAEVRESGVLGGART